MADTTPDTQPAAGWNYSEPVPVPVTPTEVPVTPDALVPVNAA